MVRVDRYLNHLTLSTGHNRRSPRSEVADGVVPTVSDMIAKALAGQTEVVPGVWMRAMASDGALHATVYAGADPLVSFAVAPTTRSSRSAWDGLGQAAKGEPPEAPWCGVTLHPEIVRHPEHTMMLGDFERCVAWTWIDGERAAG